MGVGYFTNNLKDSKGSLVGKNFGGFLKRKLRSKVEENEKAILKGIDFDPISYAWRFRILGGGNTENRKGYQ